MSTQNEYIGSAKVLALIPKRKDFTDEAFHDYYRHPHGTLGNPISTMRRYVQSHQIHTDYLDNSQSKYGAVAELWFDSLNDASTFREHPIMVDHVIDDEPNFVDLDNLQFLLTKEDVVYSNPKAGTGLSAADMLFSPENRPISTKLLHFIGKEHTEWISDEDESLGLRIGALRHVRCIPTADVLDENAAFIGVRELWWPTRTAFQKGVEADKEAFEKLIKKTEGCHILLAQAERWR
ncbi:EthD domain-containing protein [Epilithonimonas hungarica]|uniref:EthD domain-containing protein n=1 Tax=Epilithonimonas hungarica TaxID=454006 RepID=A0A1G7SAQ7_9FLAO|nr:EthD domain-containing protein [Epilithonimonas hungarica]SDG20137.1 conserved hypothetical protein [Epilithonimonas hungarica]